MTMIKVFCSLVLLGAAAPVAWAQNDVPTLAGLVSTTPELSIFADLLERTGYAQSILADSRLSTLFMPTNEAWNATLGADFFERLQTPPYVRHLKSIVEMHIEKL